VKYTITASNGAVTLLSQSILVFLTQYFGYISRSWRVFKAGIYCNFKFLIWPDLRRRQKNSAHVHCSVISDFLQLLVEGRRLHSCIKHWQVPIECRQWPRRYAVASSAGSRGRGQFLTPFKFWHVGKSFFCSKICVQKMPNLSRKRPFCRTLVAKMKLLRTQCLLSEISSCLYTRCS